MFGRRRTQPIERDIQRAPRGGVSRFAVVTGLVVAVGTTTVLAAIAAAIAAALHLRTDTLSRSGALRAAYGLGLGVVAVVLLSYLWGGYAAGRMARGTGVRNGLLVPLLTAVLGGLGVLVAWGLDITTRLQIPVSTWRLGLSHARLVEVGTVIGAASVVAMFVGAGVGGALGARWHAKLDAVVERPVREPDPRRTLDLRDERVDEAATTTPVGARRG